ncbi:hypothetical protein HAX54_027452 [Datura stramonium]|uniref:Clathrin/coatomer adaptor adaptin-like N-terminal domain-containing protein n=1 Tax=Datura stramonium TaxID=4076 RepID=A0ABS8S8U2_DATST|nr:hypothetical protein [Datura stramonium]
MEKSCSLLIHFDKGTPALANEIREREANDVPAKIDAMKKAVMLLLNGETLPQLFITIGRYNLRNNLQHPNEYIRGVTLRFLCRLNEVDIIEPLIPSIMSNLEHRHPYVKRNAILAVMAVYKLPQGEQLPQMHQKRLKFFTAEQDPSAKRNAFLMLFQCAQERAINYLLAHVDRVSDWGNFRRVASTVLVHLLMDFLGDNNVASAIDSSFVREIIETNPKLRVSIVTRLLDTFYQIRAARVCSCALWIIGEYCISLSEVESGIATIKQCLGDLPFYSVSEEGEANDSSKSLNK